MFIDAHSFANSFVRALLRFDTGKVAPLSLSRLSHLLQSCDAACLNRQLAGSTAACAMWLWSSDRQVRCSPLQSQGPQVDREKSSCEKMRARAKS